MADKKEKEKEEVEEVKETAGDRAKARVEARVKFDADKAKNADKDLPKVGSLVDFKEKNGSVVPAIIIGKKECRVREDGTVENAGTTGSAFNHASPVKNDEWGRPVTVFRPVAIVFSIEQADTYKITL